MVLLGALGLLATSLVLTRAQSSMVDLLPTLLGTMVAVALLPRLLRAVASAPQGAHSAQTLVGAGSRAADGPARRGEGSTGPDDSGSTARADGSAAVRDDPAWSRRRALVGVGTLGIGALLATAVAQGVTTSRELARRAAQFVLPSPKTPAAPIPPGTQVDLEGMPPFLTPAEDFYRIDTALSIPRVEPTTWSLRIYGLVENEIEMSLQELLAEDMIETHLTLTCVSNPVGGNLAGNATWLGVPVRTLLARAGVQEGADMVLSRSIDGFTASTPLEALTDERDALIAVGMNGEALPPVHGYPVRMVVPGLYGYVSATKWLTELKVTRFADDLAYWSTRGWSERGPIKLASRIDVPRSGDELQAGADGAVALGGTAWAQQRGISGVQVQIDGGGWQDATLGAEVSADTWTQWSVQVSGLASGRHTATVRALDGTGELQTSQPANVAPDGASGWHGVDFIVA